MDENETIRVDIPVEMSGMVLLDMDGTWYRFIQTEESSWGGLRTKQTIKLAHGTDDIASLITTTIRDQVKQGLRQWQSSATVELDNLAQITDPLIQTCLTTGERHFRKEFLTALGTQGESLFSQFIGEKINEIYKMASQEKKASDTVFTIDGPFPANARFRWQLKTPKHTYTAFCLESEPQRRSITISVGKRKKEKVIRIVFPWMYYIAYFVDDEFYEDTTWNLANNQYGLAALNVFYGCEALKNINNILYLCNIPQVLDRWPFGTCLGDSRPPVRLSDPKWSQTLLDYFWESTFRVHPNRNYWGTKLFFKTADAIPEMKSMETWIEFSKRQDHLVAVCQLPWLKCEYSLSQVAKKYLEQIAQRIESKYPAKDNVLDNDKIKLMAIQFKEQLEEKISFLGAHFSVSQNTLETVKKFLSSQLATLRTKLVASLDKHCIVTGQKIGNEFTNHSKKGE